MTRQEIIKYLQEGEYSAIAGKNVFISFGQLPPEVQAEMRKIGIALFTEMDGGGNWHKGNGEFLDGWIYKLSPDYADLPVELEIISQYLATAQEQLGILQEKLK